GDADQGRPAAWGEVFAGVCGGVRVEVRSAKCEVRTRFQWRLALRTSHFALPNPPRPARRPRPEPHGRGTIARRTRGASVCVDGGFQTARAVEQGRTAHAGGDRRAE